MWVRGLWCRQIECDRSLAAGGESIENGRRKGDDSNLGLSLPVTSPLYRWGREATHNFITPSTTPATWPALFPHRNSAAACEGAKHALPRRLRSHWYVIRLTRQPNPSESIPTPIPCFNLKPQDIMLWIRSVITFHYVTLVVCSVTFICAKW